MHDNFSVNTIYEWISHFIATESGRCIDDNKLNLKLFFLFVVFGFFYIAGCLQQKVNSFSQSFCTVIIFIQLKQSAFILWMCGKNLTPIRLFLLTFDLFFVWKATVSTWSLVDWEIFGELGLTKYAFRID